MALSSKTTSDGIAQERSGGPSTAAEPESAGPGFKTGSEAEQIDLLRRLLGVEAPKPAPAAPPVPSPVPSPESAPVAEPVAVPAEAAPVPSEPEPASSREVEPAPSSPRRGTPAPTKAAPKPKAPAKPAPRHPVAPAPREATPALAPAPPIPAPEPASVSTPVPEKAEPARNLPAVYGRPSLDAAAPPTPNQEKGLLGLSGTDLPPPGTFIDGANVDRWSHVLTPSMRWALHRGARIEVAAPKPIVMEPWRIAATEKYSSQVRLAPDKKSLLDYVAGIPFPFVTENDPDAAIKVVFNFENRIILDDLEARNFGCETGSISVADGLNVERAGRFGALRRLYYMGRLVVDPKPKLPNPEGFRYRESLFPVLEPFNNKGAGFTYGRYLDPARQDDAWLYLPATRRVRRLSTAQRSDGIFGVDIDLDSYGGFAGNPAWFEWKLLGKKTLLAPMHSKEEPVKWCDKPGDFLFCDIWEPREMYIVAARSLIPGYNFSLRILYIDAQSMLIPYNEVYDHAGQLWRGYIQQFKSGVDRPMSYATKSVYPVPVIFISALTVFDMQLEHTSRCQFPAVEAKTEEGWYYWFGNKGGTSEDDFDVKNFLTAGH